MPDRFVQIHFLTSYAGTLLNRDDMGFAKRLPFGGAERTRVSSQCQKRHWRTFEGQGALSELDEDTSIRSRHTLEHYALKPLLAEGIDQEKAEEAVNLVIKEVLGSKPSSKQAGATEQVTVLGPKEIDFLVGVTRDVAQALADGEKVADVKKAHLGKDAKDNLRALVRGAGLDAALFGRMVTGDMLARVDAAIHVAHALTVHEAQVHDDYFSAVDDLTALEGETGSGHINSTQLTSGLFYGYVVIDIPLLVANLGGDKALARGVLERLVRIVATVSPGAKKGATAPYANASLVLVEAGDEQPRTLANAYLKPVPTQDAERHAIDALAAYVKRHDAMYEPQVERAMAALHAPALGGAIGADSAVSSLRAVASWAAGRI